MIINENKDKNEKLQTKYDLIKISEEKLQSKLKEQNYEISATRKQNLELKVTVYIKYISNILWNIFNKYIYK